eukprot:gene6704-9196_t
MRIKLSSNDVGREVIDMNNHIPQFLARDMKNANTREKMVEVVVTWIALLRKDTMTELIEWVEVLNLLDGFMETILSKNGFEIVLRESGTKQSTSLSYSDINLSNSSKSVLDSDVINNDVHDLKSVLKLTVSILKFSANKDIYNSAEHLVELLYAYDCELSFLALEALEALAVPHLTHRWVNASESRRHSTVLHKNVQYFVPLFDIVETTSEVTMQDGMTDNYQLNSDLFRIKPVVNAIRSKVGRQNTQEFFELLNGNANEIRDISTDNRTMKEILKEYDDLPLAIKYTIMCAIRTRRLMLNPQQRVIYFRMRFQACSILLGCHPDASVLINFFQDKIHIIKDALFMLRTGPGSVEYHANFVPLDLRMSAVQCLVAVVGSRDPSTSPIFTRYPWLMHDLGVNRGQYMGLIPCLLRSATSYMTALCNNTLPVEDKQEVREVRLLWIEQIFVLLNALVSLSTIVLTLTDNGLISSILNLLKAKDATFKRPATLVFVEVIAADIIELAIGNSSTSLLFFKEQHGPDICLQRLVSELSYINSIVRGEEITSMKTSLPDHSIIIIQELFSLISSYIQDARQDSSDHRLIQMYKNDNFTICYTIILANPLLFNKTILSPALALLSEIMNNDPSPPTVHLHMLGNGMAESCLNVLGFKELTLSSEMIQAILSIISTTCLTSSGLELVLKINPFSLLFSIFFNPSYVYPNSNMIMNDLPCNIGGSLEELLRHYPVLIDQCLTSFMDALNNIYEIIEQIKRNNSDTSKSSGIPDCSCYHFASASLSCLEPLLLKQQTATLFMEKGGVNMLMMVLRLGCYPRRNFLAMTCTSISKVSAIGGFFPVISGVLRCLHQVAELDPACCFKFAVESVNEVVQRIKSRNLQSELYHLFEIASQHTLLTSIGPLPTELEFLADTLSDFVELDCLVDLLSHIIQPPTTQKLSKQVVELLDGESYSELINTILCDLYVSTQLAMAKAHANRLSQLTDLKTLQPGHHPTYHLMIVSTEPVIVKEGIEDSSKKACKYSRGNVLVASERKYNSNNVLKYRVEEGWINVYRNNSPVEPQVIVLDLSQNASTEMINEFEYEGLSSRKRRELFRLCSVSLHWSVNNVFEHFHSTIKDRFVLVLSKTLFDREQPSFALSSISENVRVFPFALSFVTSLKNCLIKFLPKNNYVEKDSSRQETSNDVRDYSPRICPMNLTKINGADKSGGVSFELDSVFVPNSSRNRIEAKDCDSLLVKSEIPTLSEFSIDSLFLSIRIADLCQAALFDNSRRSRSEVNHLIMIHLLHDENTLERIIHATSQVYLSSLDPLCESRNETDISLQSALDESNISNQSDGSFEITNRYSQYKSHWSLFLERRALALSHVDTILDFWKLIFSASAVAVSSTNPMERSLQRYSSETRHYDPVVFKRQLFILCTRYLPISWSHSSVHSLPPSVIKNVLELMTVVVKALQDARLLPASSPSVNLSSTPSKASIMGSGSSHLYSRSGMRRSLGEGPQRVLGLRESSIENLEPMAPSIRAEPASYPASNTTISRLQDMGFTRALILQAINTLRTNSVQQLIPYIIEHPFLDPITTTSVETTGNSTINSNLPLSPTAQAALNVAINATLGNTTSTGGSVETIGNRTIVNNLPLSLSAQAALNVAINATLGNTTVTSDEMLVESNDSLTLLGDNPAEMPLKQNVLPLIAKLTEIDINKERDILMGLLSICGKSIITTSVHLIQFGCCDLANDCFDNDVVLLNQNITREIFTVMVLNQALKCLERSGSGDIGLAKIIVLGSIFEVGINIMNDLQSVLLPFRKNGVETISKCSKLYGILHAILIIFSSMSSANASTRQSRPMAVNFELSYLIFTMDSRYIKLYEKLIESLASFTSSHDIGDSFVMDESSKSNEINWVTPALLILDIIAQPVLLDAGLISSTRCFSSFEHVVANFLSPFQDAFEKDMILTNEVKHKISHKYFSKTAQKQYQYSYIKTYNQKYRRSLFRSHEKSEPLEQASSKRKLSSLNPPAKYTNEIVEEINEPDTVKLPLLPTILTSDQSLKCINICIGILNRSFNVEKNVLQGCLQLLVHLTRDSEARKLFYDLDGCKYVLTCSSSFEGMSYLTFTLLQQVLEDSQYLSQAMSAAIKLSFLRLSHQRASKVTLKNFLEVTIPLIYRDQNLFLEVLRAHTKITKSDGVTYIDCPITSSQEPSELLEGKDKAAIAVDSDVLNEEITIKRQKTSHLNDPVSAPQSVQSAAIINSNNDSAQKAVQELIYHIVLKWSQAKHINSNSSKSSTPLTFFTIKHSALSISELLLVLADLISTLPNIALSVHKFSFKRPQAHSNRILAEEMSGLFSKQLPLTHSLTGSPLSTSQFITFVVHCILMNNFVPMSQTKSSKPEQLSSSESAIQEIVGEDVRDAASYFIAALASRPGDGRKRILSELLSVINLIPTGYIIDSTDKFKSLVTFSDCVRCLLNPPEKWQNRDAFILPVRDILLCLVKLNAHKAFCNVMSCLKVDHPLSFDVGVALSGPLDSLIRKGLGRSAALLEQNNLKQQKGSNDKKNVDLSNITTQNVGNVSEAADVVTSASMTIDSHPVDQNVNENMIPMSPMRQQRSDTLQSENSALLNTSILSPGLILDDEDRQHDHDHLLRPTEYAQPTDYSSEEDNDENDNNNTHNSDEDQNNTEDENEEEDENEFEEDEDDEDNDDDDDNDPDDGGNDSIGGGEHNPMDLSQEQHLEEDEIIIEDEDDDEDEDDHQDDDNPDEDDDSMGDGGQHQMDLSHDQPLEEDDIIVEDDEDDDENDNDDNEGSENSQSGARLDHVGANRDEINIGGADGYDDNLLIDANFPEFNSEGDDDGDNDDDVEDSPQNYGQDGLDEDADIIIDEPNISGFEASYRPSSFNLEGGRSHGHRRNIRRMGAMFPPVLSGGAEISGSFRVRMEGNEMVPLQMSDFIDVVNGAMGSHRVVRDNNSIGSNQGILMNDFHQFFSNIIPSHAISSAATTVDPRSGSVTLSFGDRRLSTSSTTHHIRPSNVFMGTGTRVIGTGSSNHYPPVHPLLTVADSRRNSNNRLFSSMRRNGAESIFAALFSHVRQDNSGFLLDNNRNTRANISPRRRSLGPIVSDRRWGTDIGDAEVVGSGNRFIVLVTAIESSLQDFIISDQPSKPEKTSSANDRLKFNEFNFLDGLEGNSMSSMNPMSDSQFGFLMNFEEDVEASRDGTGSDSDDDDNDSVAMLEESKEEGELQESKEADIIPPLISAILESSTDAGNVSAANQNSSDVDNVLQMVVESSSTVPPSILAEDSTTAGAITNNSIPIPAEWLLSESSNVEMEVPVPSNTTNNSNLADGNTATTDTNAAVDNPSDNNANNNSQAQSEGISFENLEFIESLPPDLRQEVLITSFDSFLRTLPEAIQEEARLLRDQSAFQFQVDTGGVDSLFYDPNVPNVPDFMREMIGLTNQPSTQITSTALDNEFINYLSTTSNPLAENVPANAHAPNVEQPSSESVTMSATQPVSNNTTEVISSSTVGTAPIDPTVQQSRDALAMFVSVREDRTNSLPYSRSVIYCLLSFVFSVNKSKWPKSLFKLLATFCRYRLGRQLILKALVSGLTSSSSDVWLFLNTIPFDEESSSTALTTSTSSDAYNLLLSLIEANKSNPMIFKRILLGISYIIRKTDRLSWIDILSQPEVSKGGRESASSSPNSWIFGCLLELLVTPAAADGSTIDVLLQVIEDICSSLSRLTVQQANALVAMQQAPPEFQNVDENSSGSISSSSNDNTNKRNKVESIATNNSNSSDAKTNVSLTKLNESENNVGEDRVKIPFPILNDNHAKIFAIVASSDTCGGISRKKLMRIMRNLSLCDSNWTLFLEHLSLTGADLASRATFEFGSLLQTLREVLNQNGDAAMALALPHLSTPRSVSEVKFLNILRLMTVLRARSSAAAPAESDIVASFVKKIRTFELWDTLCDCLDAVRELEGIVDTDVVHDGQMSSNDQAVRPRSNSSSSVNMSGVSDQQSFHKNQHERENKVKLSALTMRFMPLIECFLTVCSCTLLVRSSKTALDSKNSTRQENDTLDSSLGKRRMADDSAELSSEGGGLPPTPNTLLIRSTSMLPGTRFRQHTAYLHMQMELDENSSSLQLISFAESNRVLLNMVLRHNVQLLEGSFSPLVMIPRCRQLLHFDIKRGYFKMKLKKMRQQIQSKMHGALRISVRRSRVFEESFQALRHKTADEMRRRLSVSFHNEEGMDAGGLTREWYSVLAREIFNADYVLFKSTGDGVTFQPNSQSFINPDHLSYFKFIGRVIGKAICDGQLLDAHFTRSFYKHILGLSVSFHDLEAIEPEYYKSLKQILDTPLDLLGLELSFTAENNDFGKVEVVDLIANGRDIEVTDENKYDYVRLISHHRMTTAIRKQELELLISGLPDIDLDDLRANTDYHGYKPSDPEIGFFWSTLRSFSKEEKALFLQFVTGTSKVPLDGFQALHGSDGVKRFNIHKAFGDEGLLPTAHTCFNQLDLPVYPNEDTLREKLMMAIKEGSVGFGFA